eukprot:5635004-Pyramimonas_sp.AAC.1
MCTEERRARKELYEGPGGDLVDGLPPVPSWLRAIKIWCRSGVLETRRTRSGLKLAPCIKMWLGN